METLNQKLRNLVTIAVSESEHNAAVDACLEVKSSLTEDKKYQELVKAVTDYENAAYQGNEKYQAAVLLCATKLLRAAHGQIAEVKRRVPKYYENTEFFANLVKTSDKTLETDARLCSFIESVINRFEKKTTRKPAEAEKFTFAEIRKFVPLIQGGILTRDEVRERIKQGKTKRR